MLFKGILSTTSIQSIRNVGVSGSSSGSSVSITTTTLSDATSGSAYSQQLDATGGDQTYVWSVISGSTPTGITLSSGGLLSGTTGVIGSATFTVQADDEQGFGNSIDTQGLSLTVVSASLGASPDWEEDWDYADTTAMLAGIAEDSSTGAGGISLLTGLTGTPGGFTKAQRSQWLASGSGTDHQIGATLSMGSWADTNQPREIWMEIYTRWSADWQSTGPYEGGGDGMKHLFIFDQDQISSGRWEAFTQIDGTSLVLLFAGEYGTSGSGTVVPGGIETALFDGTWKLTRFHGKMDNSSGVWEAMIDGNYVSFGTGGDTDRASDKYFKYIALGRNINRGVNQDQELDWGPVRVYITDPGWSFG